MLRKFAIGLAGFTVMLPGFASALGVGGYELNSYLNRPLDMTVQLREVGDLSADQILVSLASADRFNAAGVERTFFLNDLKFAVDVSGGHGVIHITSDKAVQEPWLDFLVQIRWPTGDLVREYTILLDPPSYDAPRATSSGATTQAAPPSTRADRYRVRRNDTVWEVARAHQPGGGVSVQQTMLAIQRLNPDAFIHNNINLVREGAVLRLPDAQEAGKITRSQAQQQMASQKRAWQGLLVSQESSTPAAAQLDASEPTDEAGSRAGSTDTDEQGQQGQGEVTLVGPEAEQDAAADDAPGGTADASASVASLQNELAIREERLDRLDRENQELASRLDDLDAQIETSNQLLQLRSQQIAALQQELRRLQEQGANVDPELLKTVAAAMPASTAGDPAEEVEDGATVAAADEDNPGSGADETGAATVGAEANNDLAVAEEEAARSGTPDDAAEQAEAGQSADAPTEPGNEADEAQSASAPATTTASASFMGMVHQNLRYIVAGLAVLFLLVLLVLRRRGRTPVDGDDDDNAGDSDAQRAPAFAAEQSTEAVDSGPAFAAPADDTPASREPAIVSQQVAVTETEDKGSADAMAAAAAVAATADMEARQKTDDASSPQSDQEEPPELVFDDEETSVAEQEAPLSSEELIFDDLSEEGKQSSDGESSDIDADSGQTEQPSRQEEEVIQSTDSELLDLDLDLSDFRTEAERETESSLDDLALDFSLDEGPAAAEPGTAATPPQGNRPAKDDAFADLDLSDLDQSEPAGDEGSEQDAPDSSGFTILAAGESLEQTEDPAASPESESAGSPPPEWQLGDLGDLGDAPKTESDDVSHAAEPVATTTEPASDDAASVATATAVDSEALGEDGDFSFLDDIDENATRLDLAQAYVDMGDAEGAREMLDEVISEGNEAQQEQARKLLESL